MPYPLASVTSFPRQMGASQSTPAPWYLPGGVDISNCKIAYLPKGAASSSAALVNIVNPGTNNAFNNGGTVNWSTSTGWDFTAGNGRLSTGYVPPNQVTRSAFARISGAAVDANTRTVFGVRNGAMTFGIRNTSATSVAVFLNGTSGSPYTHSSAIASGVVGISGLNAYLNGLLLGVIGSGTYDAGSSVLNLGDNTTSSQFFNGFIQAFVAYDITLTSTQVSILSASMAAL